MRTRTVDRYLTSPVRQRILTLGDFGETLLAIKQGLRMRRHGWDPKSYIGLRESKGYCRPWIYHKTAEGPIVQWVASQQDLLAMDWRTL